MLKKTKKTIIRRKFREVILLKPQKDSNFICPHCGYEQFLNLSESKELKKLNETNPDKFSDVEEK